MLLLVHTTTGAIIGEKINDPIVISVLALISHFVLDRIPHWNYTEEKVDKWEYNEQEKFELWKYIPALPDIITGVAIYILFLFSFPDQWLNISLGVCFAILPDLITFTKHIPKIKVLFRPFNKLHFQLQGRIEKYNKTVLGLAIQIAYLGLLITLFIII